MKCACRYLHPPGNKHEESVISVAALPVDAGQYRGGQGGGLAPAENHVCTFRPPIMDPQEGRINL